jgi:Cof subfamily protein (haloacid dehalogenase superfamily)
MTQTRTARSNGRFRLLACDIDNTLVRFPDPPSPRVARAIRAAADAGVTVALVTGRAYQRALPVARALNLTTPIICNHGGSIRDSVTGATIQRTTLSREGILEVCAWFRAQGLYNLVFDVDTVYRDCTLEHIVPEFHLYARGPGSVYAEDLSELLPAQIEVLMATGTDRERIAQTAALAQDKWGDAYRVLYSHPYAVDTLPQVHKSDALAWLSRELGVSRNQILALGDGINDVDLLSWAGLGVCMGDGHPEAQAVADVIAPPFAQDGVAWAVERYILGDRSSGS